MSIKKLELQKLLFFLNNLRVLKKTNRDHIPRTVRSDVKIQKIVVRCCELGATAATAVVNV